MVSAHLIALPEGPPVAGDWIKLRDSLWENPKVLALAEGLARLLQTPLEQPPADPVLDPQKCNDYCNQSVITTLSECKRPVTSCNLTCAQSAQKGPLGAVALPFFALSQTHFRLLAIGALYRTWTIADQHSDDGSLKGFSPSRFDMLIGIPGWSQLMISVGWLAVTEDSQVLIIPEFDEHNGQSAKRRAAVRNAVQRFRARQQTAQYPEQEKPPRKVRRKEPISDSPGVLFEGSEEVSETCNQHVINPLSPVITREEKRREENMSCSLPSSSSPSDFQKTPENASTAMVETTNAMPTATVSDPDNSRQGQEEIVLVFPTQGKARQWELTTSQVSLWQECYPGLDVLAECRKALAWLQADPLRLKTPGGMRRYLVGWFNRAVERSSSRSAQPAPSPTETHAERIRRIASRDDPP